MRCADLDLPAPDPRPPSTCTHAAPSPITCTTSAWIGCTSPPSSAPRPVPSTAMTSPITRSSTRPAAAPRAWSAFAQRPRAGSGMGILIDIVPNHMGVATPAENAWWWDVLTHGRAVAVRRRVRHRLGVRRRPGADPGARRPAAGSADDAELDALEIVDGELRYHEHRYPLAPGTPTMMAHPPATVHDRQHYEFVNWRRADDELNYRRFFAVNTLAGIRVEVPWVFDESHAEIVRWIAAGLADGLRVDHPDGLADPGGYLDRLAEATGGAYVVVEKILGAQANSCPASWSAAGTTGTTRSPTSTACSSTRRPSGARCARRASCARPDRAGVVAELIHDTKRAVADGILRSEVLRLARDCAGGRGDSDRSTVPSDRAADAIAELLACFPGVPLLPAARDATTSTTPRLARRRPPAGPRRHDRRACAGAGRRRASGGDPLPADVRHGHGQGVEDTRVLPLHAASARSPRWAATRPSSRSTSTSSTAGSSAAGAPSPRVDDDAVHPRHQARRGRPRPNRRAGRDPAASGRRRWRAARSGPLGDGPLESLLWQAVDRRVAGDARALHALRREGGTRSGRLDELDRPGRRVRGATARARRRAFDDPDVSRRGRHRRARSRATGLVNSLSAKLHPAHRARACPTSTRAASCGRRSLVDPDNRRPVDFDARRRLLARLDAGALPAIDETRRGQAAGDRASAAPAPGPARAVHPATLPVAATGAAADHVVAFDRGGAVAVATRLPVGLARDGGWGDTRSCCPRRPVVDVFTGRGFAGGAVAAGRAARRYPVALLVPRRPRSELSDVRRSGRRWPTGSRCWLDGIRHPMAARPRTAGGAVG